MEDLNKLRDIDALKISLASSDEILSWSHGEVTKPETINYRTFKPEKDGLFCERIFGPVKDYECYCGKYKRIRYKGVVCDRCGVQVTTSKVRRERMGHIVLSSPVVHVWFFKNIPSIMATLLGIAPRSIELIVYFSSYIVTEIDYKAKKEVLSGFDDISLEARGKAHAEIQEKMKEKKEEAEGKVKSLSNKPEKSWSDELKRKAETIRRKSETEIEKIKNEDILEQERAELVIRKMEKKLQEVELHTVMTDREFIELEEYLDGFCKVMIGAEAIRQILSEFDVNKVAEELRTELAVAKTSRAEKIRKRLMVMDSFIHSGVKPLSMIISILPVLPPDLRPMVQLEGGRFATSDLNDLYRRIINRNNRLKRLIDLGAPDMIIRNEKRMLQESVDALIDSSKVRKTRARDRKTYRSLADAIKGKQGHFRANLLGKRVDYSGRAVIVPGPDLKMDECGVPTEMALELFKPFLIREIMKRGLAPNMKTAKYVLEDKKPEVYAILEELVKTRPVILNRAPTLHRLSIQAFYTKLTEGKAIQLHPVVCAGFNADFDGDQMAIHLPLSEAAVKETEDLMISTENLLKPADSSVVTIPSHEMVLGLYYLTSVNPKIPPAKIVFADNDEVLRAFSASVISVRQKIKVQLGGEVIETTAGRIILNQFIPEELGFINLPMSKSDVQNLIRTSIEKAGVEKTVVLIDELKYHGFKYSTISGISLSIFDCARPSDLDEVMADAYKEIDQIEQNYHMGLITKSELSKLSNRVWVGVVDHLDQTILSHIDEENPVRMIISAKAGKASPTQVRQIAAIKGLIADPSGRTIDMPVLGNYATGMSSFDYFLTGRGTRRSYMDKGLGTADAGYLTRRLVNVAQDVIVREEDCGTKKGRVVKRGQDTPLHPWYNRLIGRAALEDIKDGRKIITKKGELITKEDAAKIDKSKINEVQIRSAMTCETSYGVCSKCYGIDMTNGKPVQIGVAVGIIAAQSIGEPGTQLTLNVFHSGGIAAENITQGLPRVEELFEIRTPKAQAKMSGISGKIKIKEEDDSVKIIVTPTQKGGIEQEYTADYSDEILVKDGDLAAPGTMLTSGSLSPAEFYEIAGSEPTQMYILEEVQRVYGSQGVSINDKHAEVIIKQMFNRVRVIDPGDTSLLSGSIVIKYKLAEENAHAEEQGKKGAKAKPVILGISKASRKSESWLDAASFEETSAVLTESAVAGSIDRLIGLKENVIIGRRIPVGKEVVIEEEVKETD